MKLLVSAIMSLIPTHSAVLLHPVQSTKTVIADTVKVSKALTNGSKKVVMVSGVELTILTIGAEVLLISPVLIAKEIAKTLTE